MAHPNLLLDESVVKVWTVIGDQIRECAVPASWKHLNTDLIAHLETLDQATDWSMIMICYVQLSAKVLRSAPSSEVVIPDPRHVESASLRDALSKLNKQFLIRLKATDTDADWTGNMSVHVNYSMQLWQCLDRPDPKYVHNKQHGDGEIKGWRTRVLETGDKWIEDLPSNSATSRPLPPGGLTGLPKELRDQIYGYLATSEVVEAHIKENKMPILLHVSYPVRKDFAEFYYGRRVFRVEFYDPQTLTWHKAQQHSATMVRAMFHNWPGCFVSRYPTSLARAKGAEEITPGLCNRVMHGVLTWTGASSKRAVACCFTPETEGIVTVTRMEEFDSDKARKRKLAKLYADNPLPFEDDD